MKDSRLYQNTSLNVNDELTLDTYASHYLMKVLRFPQGQNITLFNGDGQNYMAEVLQAKKDCIVKILEKTKICPNQNSISPWFKALPKVRK